MREKIFVGCDFAAKPKWWQKFLGFFGLKKYRTDYSCMTFWKRDKNGDMTLERIKYL